MDEARDRGHGPEPLQPAPGQRSPRSSDDGTGSPCSAARLRADVDILNATNLHTENLFGLWVAQDLDDPSRYAPFLLQGGLEMPDRDYYLTTSPRDGGHPRAVPGPHRRHAHAGAVAERRGQAARIFDLETSIAKVHASREDTEDVQKGNNHWPRRTSTPAHPGLDWGAFFAAAGLGRPERASSSGSPARSPASRRWWRASRSTTWKDYLAFHALEHHAAVLPKAFVDEHFAFHGTALSGTPELRDRWKRARRRHQRGARRGRRASSTSSATSRRPRRRGPRRWCATSWPRSASGIDNLEWMAPETKAKAKAKLATLKVGVGYPDTWRDYSGLEVASRRRSRQRRARGAVRVPRATWTSSAGPSTAASG